MLQYSCCEAGVVRIEFDLPASEPTATSRTLHPDIAALTR